MRRQPAFIVLGALLVAAGDRVVVGRPSDALGTQIDALLSAAYPPGGPGAAVRVTKDGAVVLSKGYGLADVESKTPVTPATPFRLASVTKAFTATAIFMLADKGLLSLDDPVTKHLPAFGQAASSISVKHLLSHTSGLPDYLSRPNSLQWAQNDYTVAQLVEDIGSRPAAFTPGANSAYSNSNYILLGAIIEKLSGKSYADFVDAHIVKPLSMNSTRCGGPWAETPRLATPYEPARDSGGPPDWSRLVPARPYTRSALYAAGGCSSSVDDLSTFSDALAKGGLIGKPSLAQSLAPMLLTSGRPGTMSQGGWQADPISGRRAAQRGGALPGVCTWFVTLPDDGVTVILLSNRTPGEPRCGALAVQIATLALGS